MSTRNPTSESQIAIEASAVLRQSFIAASQSGTVLYVENDTVVSKAPNGQPVVVKHLSGRNPDFDRKFTRNKTFRLKKRNVEVISE